MNGPMPSLAVRIRVDAEEVVLQLASSDDTCTRWIPVSKVTIATEKLSATQLVDKIAEGLLVRLTDIKLVAGKKVKGKATYTLKIENASPLILNGLSIGGKTTGEDAKPSSLAGFGIPPHRTVSFPITAELVDQLKLKAGVRPVAADLSGL